MTSSTYTTQLQAGLGRIDETRILLELWQPGMSTTDLERAALQSGRFPNVSARRVRNLVVECFAPRYLVEGGKPALLLRTLKETFSAHELEQTLFLFTCRAQLVLTDFVCEVYWNVYTASRRELTNEDARSWVAQANQAGKTTRPWSKGTIQNVAGYLTGVCADYGLLERGQKTVRRIQPFRVEPRVAAILAYDLHFKGHGDNGVLSHSDWALFGLTRDDVLDEMKRLTLRGWLIVQSAGGVTRMSWLYKSMEELAHVLAHG